MNPKRLHRCVGNQRGFTLIEMLVAFLIGIFILGATVALMDFSARTFRTQERVAETQQDVRAAMDLMVKEIRMASFNPMRGASPIIEEATNTAISFELDRNQNNAIDAANEETITYRFNVANSSLDRGVDGGTEVPLVNNVNNLTFTYLDKDGEATVTTSDIRSVRISLTCQAEDATKKTFVDRNLTSTVNIRNIFEIGGVGL